MTTTIEENLYKVHLVVFADACRKIDCVWYEQELYFNLAYQLARLQIAKNYLRPRIKLNLEIL
jgi:hypothetical protein